MTQSQHDHDGNTWQKYRKEIFEKWECMGGGDSLRCSRRVVLGNLHGDMQPCSPNPGPT